MPECEFVLGYPQMSTDIPECSRISPSMPLYDLQRTTSVSFNIVRYCFRIIKATEMELSNYRNVLDKKLISVYFPWACFTCFNCVSGKHKMPLKNFMMTLYPAACHQLKKLSPCLGTTIKNLAIAFQVGQHMLKALISKPSSGIKFGKKMGHQETVSLLM